MFFLIIFIEVTIWISCFLLNYYIMYCLVVAQLDEPSTADGVEHSRVSNNLSIESLEMPALPAMDSDDGDHY